MKIKGRLQSEIEASYNLVIEIFLPNPRASERKAPSPSPFTEACGKLCMPNRAVRIGPTRKLHFYGEILESETICKYKSNTLISFTLVRVKNE